MTDEHADATRMNRVEEAAAFTDHRVDQLSAELIRAYERINTLESRLDRLERRLATMESTEDLPDPLDDLPPHSIG